MLVAMVPFITMAQKRSKKNKNAKTEVAIKSNATYEFLVIKGIEYLAKPISVKDMDEKALMYTKLRSFQNMKFMISYDFGLVKNQENSDLMGQSERQRTMSAAVNHVAEKGWEFYSANVTNIGDAVMHYYYMRRAVK